MRRIRVITCLILLGLLIPAILQTRGKLPTDVQPLIEAKYGGWAGVLRLWVCERWQPGAGSVSGWLNKCISTFEKKHPGVYVQPEYVDASTLRALGRDGLPLPDMALFPPGGLDPAMLLPLEGEFSLREGLPFDERAAPVLLGGYMWAYNPALLDRLPTSWRNLDVSLAAPPDDAAHQWGAALLALCAGKYSDDGAADSEDSHGELELGLLPSEEATSPPAESDGPLRCLLPEGFAQSESAWRDFINGDAAAMPVSQREIRRLQALSDQGRVADWHLASSGQAFTDQAMYIGVVDRPEAEESRALCRAFVGHLLGDACQNELHRAGAFSVTRADSGYAAGDPLSEMDALLRRRTIVVPGPFDGDWIGDVSGIVRKFIDGDPDPAALWGQCAERIGQISEH